MTVIVTKNSSTASAVPLTSDLVQGELAVNVTDKRIFTENASTEIVELGTNPSTITTTTATVTGVLTANGTLASSNAVLTGGTVNSTPIGATTPSTIAGTLVTASTGFTGGLTGNVTGNVTGNLTGNVTGDVTGDLTGNVTAATGTTTLTNLVVNGTVDFTDTILTNLATPVSSTDAATKGYVDTAVSDVINAAPAALDTLNELAAALGDDANFATTVTDSIALKLPLAGGTMSGAIAMGTAKITGLGDPTGVQDAATKTYVDTADALKLNLSGGTMSGAIAMGTNKITGAGDPTAAQDVATKAYTDTILGSATAAATSAAAAATSASAASTSASGAATSATNAATSATAASGSATAAASSASASSASETATAASETAAAASEAAAATSESNSAASETASASSASASATSAASASTSATNAATSETNAASSATAAATSASAASTSATAASGSATAAAGSATAAAASFDQFDDIYLGAKSAAPTVDNDGDALATGALYFNTVSNTMFVYSGSSWAAAGSAVNGTAERQEYTATSGQTTFSATYDVGFVDVYLNGSKLIPTTDFTASNGATIVLGTGAVTGDNVSIIAYGAFNVADVYTQAQSDARYTQQSNNLSDLDSAATARTNLGLGTIATAATSDYAATTNNLSDLADSDTALTNLGLTATATELNYTDGVTSNIQTQIDNIDALPSQTGNDGLFLTTDGSTASWSAAGGGAWELLSTTTVSSSVATIDIPLSSSHDVYMVVLDNIATGVSAGGYLRWKRGGSFLTSGLYDYVEIQTSINSRTGQTSFKLCRTNNSNRNANGIIYLSNINNTGAEGPSYFHQSALNQEILLVGGNNTSGASSSAVTDIRLYWDNNVTSGSVSVYTLKKS